MPIADSESKQQFVEMIGEASKYYSHAELAEKLDIERWRMRNWLYRDLPNAWTVRTLMPRLRAVLKSGRTKKNH
jgi:hypothetical protein